MATQMFLHGILILWCVFLVVLLATTFIVFTVQHCYLSAYIYAHLMDKTIGRPFDKIMKHDNFEFISERRAGDIECCYRNGNANKIYRFMDAFWTYNNSTNKFELLFTNWCKPLFDKATLHAANYIN